MDWFEAAASLGGKGCQLQFFAMRSMASEDALHRAYPLSRTLDQFRYPTRTCLARRESNSPAIGILTLCDAVPSNRSTGSGRCLYTVSSMAAGYVYVLANSSMPGLVKVGKTTRLPSERAEELSGVTGVATPFIVVYEERFEDCDAVEAHVHTILAAKGLRISENREFFRAAVSDVVKTIASATAASGDLGKPEFKGLRNEGLYILPCAPWSDIMDEASRHYNGTDDYFQDYSEAFRLYSDAARLGSSVAYEYLGQMHRRGEGVRENKQNALDCYKEGAKMGNYHCYAVMAEMFVESGHQDNARKAFAKFISSGEADGWKMSLFNVHIVRMISILKPPQSGNIANWDMELFSIARAYLVQLRDQVKKWNPPTITQLDSAAPMAALLYVIESNLK